MEDLDNDEEGVEILGDMGDFERCTYSLVVYSKRLL